MTWTAEVTEVGNDPKQPINILVKGRLINTDTQEVIPFATWANDLTPATVADIVRKQVAAVEARDAAKPALQTGPIDLTPPAVSEREKFLIADRKLASAMAAHQRGYINDDLLNQLKAEAAALYKPEYFGL